MQQTEKQENRKRFLVNVAFWAVIIAIVYVTLKYLVNLVMPFFLATIFAALARPVARFLSAKERKVKQKDGSFITVPRKVRLNYNVAAILSIILLFIVLLGLLTLIVAPIVNIVIEKAMQLPSFYESTLSPALDNILARLDSLPGEFEGPLQSIIESASDNLTSSLGSIITSLSGKAVVSVSSIATSLPNILLKGLICIIATVFILLDFDLIAGFFRRNLESGVLRVVREVKNSLVDIVWQFIRSYFFIFLITMAEITVGLLIIGKSHPLLIGLLIAIFDAFPVVGSGMILLPWSVITMITSGFGKGIGLFILYLVVVIVRQIIEPKIVGKHVGLRPIVTLVSMFVGSKLFGAIGLFGLPIAAAILTDLNSSGKLSLFKKSGEENPVPGESVNSV